MFVSDGRFTDRGCDTSMPVPASVEGSAGCGTDIVSGITMSVCVCNSDWCNSH